MICKSNLWNFWCLKFKPHNFDTRRSIFESPKLVFWNQWTIWQLILILKYHPSLMRSWLFRQISDFTGVDIKNWGKRFYKNRQNRLPIVSTITLDSDRPNVWFALNCLAELLMCSSATMKKLSSAEHTELFFCIKFNANAMASFHIFV